MMYVVITILAIVAGILLGAIVLIQNPKGGGLNSSFGGVGQQLLGARRSTDVVEKTTWGLAAALLLFCLLSCAFIGKKTTVQPNTTPDSELVNKMKSTPSAPASGFGGQQQQQPAAPAGGQPQPGQ
ncbi:MAG: preprotein translocase subunit SecG [Chitinophagales bacterium]